MEFPVWSAHCYKNLASITTLAAKISIRDGPCDHPESELVPTEQDASNYEIEACVYERVRERFLSLLSREPTDASDADKPVKHTDDAMVLRPPVGSNAADGLFEALAAKLTMEVGGRLVVLEIDDLIDLMGSNRDSCGNGEGDGADEGGWETDYSSDEDWGAPRESNSRRATPSASSNDSSPPVALPEEEPSHDNGSPEVTAPPVVVIIHRLLDQTRWRQESEDRGEAWVAPTERDTTDSQRGSLLTIIKDDTTMMKVIQQKSAEIIDQWSVQVAPTSSPTQESLFAHDEKQRWRHQTIRRLQRFGRWGCPDRHHALLQPYAEWTFPEGSTVAASLHNPECWDGQRMIQFQRRLVGKKRITMKVIISAMEKVVEGNDSVEKAAGSEPEAWRARYPPRIWPIVEKIMEEDEDAWMRQFGGMSAEQEERDMERKMLETLVDTGAINATWADIEIDSEVKAQVKRMISLFDRRPYLTGILKRSATAGALLYGPPGTGKTHLARVIAKETSSVMLRVSAAEIGSKWMGETEKQIRALFSLARKLSPAIVFIDEADAIFQSRSGVDHDWRRSLVNQLLGEIGGFENSPSSPLLLLATNFPQDLDPAVIRRVPNKIFVGLPSCKAREGIFRICLKEESLDENVDLKELAKDTEGYTGSDIEFICQQAAFAALEGLEVGSSSPLDDPIVLNESHFSQALDVSNPSVSRSAMGGILRFAAEFDRSASVRMKGGEKEPEAPKPGRLARSQVPERTSLSSFITSTKDHLAAAKRPSEH